MTTDDLTFFQVVSSATSLAEAARRLNVTPPAVTQRLRAIEDRIGVRLIERTSRRLSLTDEGELVASEGASIIAAIEDLSERLASRTSKVRGHLRVAAPWLWQAIHRTDRAGIRKEASRSVGDAGTLR
ncbi:LysR family transcriptional regulator [Mesorhizobium sp.]|uniref:LysR family transcriptional regulator n=1 Tax=Mesorhizobium sp. TaxID=1871066 RepID=UPI00345C1BF1